MSAPLSDKPTFASSITALRTTDPRFPWIGPTPEEADAADALEIVHQHHRCDAEVQDAAGGWGPCLGCGEPWPCPTWTWGSSLAIQWIGRAAGRVWTHARSILDRRAA